MKRVPCTLYKAMLFRSSSVFNNITTGDTVLSGYCSMLSPTVNYSLNFSVLSGLISQTLFAYLTMQSFGTSKKIIKSITLLPVMYLLHCTILPSSFDNVLDHILGFLFSSLLGD